MRAAARGGVILMLACGAASAQTLIPGRTEAGYDATLASKLDGYDRQIHALLSVPVGYGLEAFVSVPANRALIDGFIASGSRDFKAQTGKHPYEVLDDYGESGDLGMFGGVQAAGDAFRYAVLRDSSAPAAEVSTARAALLRVMEGMHWGVQITGVPGVVSRGIMRVEPAAGEPPLPGPRPITVPMFDAQGKPQPTPKTDTWREDRSGKLPFLVWLDNCSKDQLDGYVFAMGAIWDVVAKDPSIPADKVATLVEDARAIGLGLMKKVELEPGRSLDLVIMDADGRPAHHHDLNPQELFPYTFSATPVNGFNALLALGIIRTLFHVTGDERIGTFYYDELVRARNYFGTVEQTVGLMYLGPSTNFSNVNMAFVAIYGLLRYEPDPRVANRIRTLLEAPLYAPGRDREARGLGQSLFDFIYAGFRKEGLTGPGATALAEGLATLKEARPAPYWDVEVTNCDAAELSAGSCVGIDGTAITLMGNGSSKATRPVPMRIRPPSNFEWRSDPYDVNGGGGPRLNPAGELAAAYWMGRYLRATTDGMLNVSPLARPRPAVVPPITEPPPRTGCGCDGAAGALLPLALLLWARRRC